MVTMLDVAKKAGVSKATVSRILNGKNVVSARVTEAVYKAIEETGYRPNILARQLATQKTSFIGFVMTNALYDGPYFSSLVYNAAIYAETHQHQLMVADGKHSAEEERNAINYLLDMKCAGIVVYPHYLSLQELDEIISHTETPIVVINRSLKVNEHNAMVTDHYHGAALIMDYILAQGHKEIAFITGLPDSSTGQNRLQAYRDKLKQSGIRYNSKRVVQSDWSLEGGYQAAVSLLDSGCAFSAVLAGNDEMAFGAMKALRERGLQLPQDISIAGFDNMRMASYVTPPLTTVKIPIEAMIQKGILWILGQTQDSLKIETKTELIIRDSVAPH